VVFGPGTINFGDGREEQLNTQSDFSLVESLGDQIEKNTSNLHFRQQRTT
jgi:hypothetical protein